MTYFICLHQSTGVLADQWCQVQVNIQVIRSNTGLVALAWIQYELKVKIFRKPNKLQNEGWEINKYRMIVCIFVMVKNFLWYLSIKLCVFYPEDLEGGTNTLYEVTEDFLSHINWQELRKVTEGFFFYTLPGWTWGK